METGKYLRIRLINKILGTISVVINSIISLFLTACLVLSIMGAVFLVGFCLYEYINDPNDEWAFIYIFLGILFAIGLFFGVAQILGFVLFFAGTMGAGIADISLIYKNKPKMALSIIHPAIGLLFHGGTALTTFPSLFVSIPYLIMIMSSGASSEDILVNIFAIFMSFIIFIFSAAVSILLIAKLIYGIIDSKNYKENKIKSEESESELIIDPSYEEMMLKEKEYYNYEKNYFNQKN